MRHDLLLLIGANGSGKSSTLQFLGALRRFARGNMDDYFEERGWSSKDIRSKVPHSGPNIQATVALEDDDGARFTWQFSWSVSSNLTMRETIWRSEGRLADHIRILEYRNRELDSVDDEFVIRGVAFKGSMLSLLSAGNTKSLQAVLMPLIRWCDGIRSLELLSPVAMRRMGRGDHEDIGPRGEHLASFIAKLDVAAKDRIVARLGRFYPVKHIETTKKRAGWIDLKIAERFDFGAIGPDHISDGFLRLLALCALPEFPDTVGLVLLDEVEDGIDPNIVSDVIQRVAADSKAQFVMTSHSPILANLVDVSDISIVGRNAAGATAIVPLDRIGVIKEGLEYFGPGELWTMLGRDKLESDLIAVTSDKRPDTAAGRYARDYVSAFWESI